MASFEANERRWVAERAEEIAEAGSDPALWAELPARLVESWPGAKSLIFGWSRQGRSLGLLYHGFDATEMADYERHYAHLNPWLRVMRRQPVLRAGVSDDTLPWQRIVRTEFYNDFLKRQPESEHGAGMKISDERDRFAAITFQYGHGVAEEYNRALPRAMQALAPALRAALDLNRALAGEQAWAQCGQDLLEAFDTPAMLVDQRGIPRLANRAAGRALERGNLLRLDVGGRLRLAQRDASTALMTRLADLARPGSPVRGEIVLRGREGSPLAVISLFPLGAAGSVPGLAWLFVPERMALLVVRMLSGDASLVSALRLKAIFGLTAAEARLAARLAQGGSLGEAATAFGIARETARAQLRAIFAKTATHRQAELVALISRL